MIPYSRQSIDESDIKAVIETLRSDWLTQGPAVERFEGAVADYCHAKHAVALSSGTAALYIACRALGLSRGDILWTSPITFVASANCALYCGASVDFVDIDSRTYNMSVEALADKLEQARKDSLLPKVVVPVHFSGQSCDMRAIRSLAERYGFRILEDASHALGGCYLRDPIGGCKYSDVTVFSFHPVKMITTGEGGMALTNDPLIAARMTRLRTHGITREPAMMTSKSEGAWYYEQLELGGNYRLTDLQASLGASQMSRLERFVERRRALAKSYDGLLRGMPIRLPWQHPDCESSWHLYVVRLRLTHLNLSRRQVFDYLRDAGIGVNVHYIPVYRQPYYKKQNTPRANCPQAECYYDEAISLPIYPELDADQQAYVVRVLREALSSLVD